jgi:RNA polymerase sigma-70 factor, ECF subfamily
MTYIEAPDEPSTSAAAKSPERDESSDFSLVAAVAERSELQNQLYLRYRRPLMQVFLQRRIDRDAAQDLLQRTFLQAIKKIRADGLQDPNNLGGYLYRTACKLATAYWRGELSRRHESDGELLSSLQDDALSLEESLDTDLRAKCVRELMAKLSVPRDREVLERFYLREESRISIRESMKLTELQFNQVLWRARQRFAEILRKQGFSGGGGQDAHPMDG